MTNDTPENPNDALFDASEHGFEPDRPEAETDDIDSPESECLDVDHSDDGDLDVDRAQDTPLEEVDPGAA